MKEEMKRTPEGRKRLEEADRKIHEYLESKLMEEHGAKDETERPGITGSKSEAKPRPSTEGEPSADVQPSGDPSAGDDTPSAHPGAGSSKSALQGAQAQKRSVAETREEQKEKKRQKQGGMKRIAEEEGDEAERGDRKCWRNYIQPASSNAAPESKGTKRETQEEEERKGKKASKPGGVKRAAEDEADDRERADRRSREDYVEPASPGQTPDSPMTADPVATQVAPAMDKRELAVPSDESGSPQKQPKISSICFGIGSADKIGEVRAGEHEEDLKTMAEEYLSAIESGGCFVHVRAKQSSNKDLRMLSQLTGGGKFKKVNLSGVGMESVVTNSGYLADVLEKANCTNKEKVEKILED